MHPIDIGMIIYSTAWLYSFSPSCRIFSVIKRNEEYQKEYKKIAA